MLKSFEFLKILWYIYQGQGENMTTEEISRKFFILLLGVATFLILGSFVVSLNIIHFLYLVVLYFYIYRIHRSMQEKEDEE